MAQKYLCGFLLLVACLAVGVSSYPSNNEYHREWRSRDDGNWYSGIDGGTNEYKYDGVAFGKGPLKMKDSNFMLFVKPVAHALSAKGTAVANPISQVVVARDQAGSIVHTPVAAAVVGPGGVAHAQSDLYLYEYVTN